MWIAGQETSKTVSFQFKVPEEEMSVACVKNPEQAIWVKYSEVGEKKSEQRGRCGPSGALRPSL